MASTLPEGNQCGQACEDQVTVQVPGPAGATGAAGAAGTNGENAHTTLTDGFTVPAVGANVTIEVGDSDWMATKSGASGHVIFIASAGYYEVQSKPDSTHAIVENLGYTGNAAPAASIATGQLVTPGGLAGAAGAAGTTDINDISPTTTKGDLMVDDGANSPAASVVRMAVGTDGQIHTAQSSQATGQQWQTLLPNGTATPADTDNRVPRFDAAAGNEEPAPLQGSSVLITDSGDVQTVGGNARGTNAVDLQSQRTLATEVASGIQSCISGGSANTASGTQSFVGGGTENTASGLGSAVVGGSENVASGTKSIALGGNLNQSNGVGAIACGITNTASGDYSMAIGSGNTASAQYSVALGVSNTASAEGAVSLGKSGLASGQYSSTSGLSSAAPIYGQSSDAAGLFGSAGDAQRSVYKMRRATTDATPAELFADGVDDRLVIPSNTTVGFQATVIGRSSTGDTAMWKVEGLIKNNGGTTALVGAPTVTIPFVDAGITGTWGQVANVAITADDPNDALIFTVTGAAVTNIRWHAVIETNEVGY